MRILVTGGAGFIGSHIVQRFHNDAEVIVLDNMRTGFKSNIYNLNATLINASITDRDVLKKALKNVDYVFHLAAMVSVPESMNKHLECVDINTNGTLILLQESADAGVKKLCLSSSAAVYGDNPQVPKVESMIPEPKSPYAVTKLDGEYYCRIFNDEGWLNTASLRYFNVFGPRQNPQSQYAAAVPIFIDKAIKNEPITIYGDGYQTRDFIYVNDIVNANVHIAMNEQSNSVYNVAYGSSITISDLARKIIDTLGSTSEIVYAPPRPGDVKHSRAAVEKLSLTGFIPQSNFDHGLMKTIEYFKSIN